MTDYELGELRQQLWLATNKVRAMEIAIAGHLAWLKHDGPTASGGWSGVYLNSDVAQFVIADMEARLAESAAPATAQP